jgi:hypothetical protein
VAIVQISRITQRKGLAQDLPQPLAGAELGWAIDERKLFIGNGELADGAPVVGNTEVLTEFSDILNLAGAYTYEGQAAGYTVQTGPTVGDSVSQSLQNRLDSYAVVTDFGAKGDGITDDTAAINRALYQLYCRQTNTQVRRSLFFPAGTYIVTNTINIPSYAMLYGEGADSSIISFNVQAHTPTIAYATGILVKNSTNYYRAIAAVPIGISVSDTDYWTPETLPAYIARTADSLQQTGVNIGANGATPPQDIIISGVSFTTNQIQDGVLIENAVQSVGFTQCTFTGPLTDPVDLNDDIAALRFASTSSLITSQATFDQCCFYGWTYGVSTQQQTKGVTISNSYFNGLYQGVVLGGLSPVNGGPTGFRIMHNLFDNIYHEGIVIDGVELNASGYNIFYDVGNEYAGSPLSAGTSTAVIWIDADQNVSIGDMFERTTLQANTVNPRIQLNNRASIGVDSAAQTQQGTYVRETGTKATLANNSSGTLYSISASLIPALQMNYTIKRGTLVRTGLITVVADAEDSAGDFSFIDDYTENNTTDVTLNASDTAVSGGNIVISWSTANTGVDANIYYSITHLYRS